MNYKKRTLPTNYKDIRNFKFHCSTLANTIFINMHTRKRNTNKPQRLVLHTRKFQLNLQLMLKYTNLKDNRIFSLKTIASSVYSTFSAVDSGSERIETYK